MEDLFEMLRGRKANPKEGDNSPISSRKTRQDSQKGRRRDHRGYPRRERSDKANTVYEIGDLMYHCMVLMIESGIELSDIRREMASCHVIDHKVRRRRRWPNTAQERNGEQYLFTQNLHTHTTFDDGQNTIEEMALAAQANG
ncbi:MAG: hypothetical protein R2912_02200 [Eubacteriales bacterium]